MTGCFWPWAVPGAAGLALRPGCSNVVESVPRGIPVYFEAQADSAERRYCDGAVAVPAVSALATTVATGGLPVSETTPAVRPSKRSVIDACRASKLDLHEVSVFIA